MHLRAQSGHDNPKISRFASRASGSAPLSKFLNAPSEKFFRRWLLRDRRIVVATWLIDNYIQFLAVHVHLLSQLTCNFYERRYYGWQNSRLVTSLERQLLNFRVPEIARYLRIYSHVSFHCSNVKWLHARSALIFHEQTLIAATRLVEQR